MSKTSDKATSKRKNQEGEGAGRSLGEFKHIHNPDADVVYLRQRIQELEAKAQSARSETGEALELVHGMQTAISICSPVKMAYKPSKNPSSPVTHVLHLTDLHYGEVINKDEIDGFGDFSPEIAEARLHFLAQKIIDKTNIQRHGYNVPHLHIIGTGDYISGGIHHELLVTNAFPEPVQAVKCGYALGAMIEMFAPHFETITADFVTLDNHGRMTKKNQAAQGGENNWGYVVAHVIKQYCSKLANVNVRVHAKPTALVTVGPEKYLCFHGHQMKGWAGKPYYGFDRRVAMEAVKRMGIPDQSFTKMVFGHYHTATNEKDWQLGGSLSGTSAFDHSCGRHSKPHQTSWFVHPGHGEFDWTRWWLDQGEIK